MVVRNPIEPVLDLRSASEPQSGGGTRSVGAKNPFDDNQLLIIQPIPKHAGEVPPFVLPRGSRQYQNAAGAWHDARDVATGMAHAASLEPFARALAREIEEEAGLGPDMLARAAVIELGAIAFQSRTKGIYPIHWFVVVPDAVDAALLDAQTPADALSVRWATLDETKAMAARGQFSAGYIPVIEAALQALHTSP